MDRMYIMIVGIVNREVSNMCVKLEELSKLTVEKLYDQCHASQRRVS